MTDSPRAVQYLGTGFCISPSWLLTCRHVLANARYHPWSIYKSVGSASEHRFDLLQDIQFHPDTDVALARVGNGAEEFYKPLPVDLTLDRALGRDVLNFSYVQNHEAGSQISLTGRLFKGYIMRTALDQRNGGWQYIEVSFPALLGMSGSPVLDRNGFVLGIIYENYRS